MHKAANNQGRVGNNFSTSFFHYDLIIMITYVQIDVKCSLACTFPLAGDFHWMHHV